MYAMTLPLTEPPGQGVGSHFKYLAQAFAIFTQRQMVKIINQGWPHFMATFGNGDKVFPALLTIVTGLGFDSERKRPVVGFLSIPFP